MLSPMVADATCRVVVLSRIVLVWGAWHVNVGYTFRVVSLNESNGEGDRSVPWFPDSSVMVFYGISEKPIGRRLVCGACVVNLAVIGGRCRCHFEGEGLLWAIVSILLAFWRRAQ